ncbi:hypothetical protein J2T55_000995 [Methylohalomonas lacus]|uniref:Uncharacterized protein n=1 Tax=Methylohalomonas lacus TaxID=398773 RepID=A0AAE3HM38_9GAMM|nr:hypothetical protein [Methylohalomonas lacus]MCS3902987.1 hypothetical protein [Methylohalomonas lacus]
MLLFAAASPVLQAQDSSPNLRPGVNPGEVVVIRRVEPAPMNRVDRDNGPITTKINLRRTGELSNGVNNQVNNQLDGMMGIALSDSQAAGVHSTPAPARQLHQALGMEQGHNLNRNGGSHSQANSSSGRLMGILNAESGRGGSIGGVMSGFSDTLKQSLGAINQQ